jgi:hypothetical protein
MIRSPISSAIRSAWRPVIGPTLARARIWRDSTTWNDSTTWTD